MNCEAVLLSGACLVDEASLTGESVPMQKEAVTESGPLQIKGRHRANFLLDGTEVLSVAAAGADAFAEARRSSTMSSGGPPPAHGSFPEDDAGAQGAGGATVEPDPTAPVTRTNLLEREQPHSSDDFPPPNAVYAVVTAIGTATLRGGLLRSMFYPSHAPFSFEVQLYQLFLVGLIAAPLVSLLIGFTLQDPFSGGKAKAQMFVPVICSPFTEISYFVNPAILPLFVAALTQSSNRLKAQGVPCLDLDKILRVCGWYRNVLSVIRSDFMFIKQAADHFHTSTTPGAPHDAPLCYLPDIVS